MRGLTLSTLLAQLSLTRCLAIQSFTRCCDRDRDPNVNDINERLLVIILPDHFACLVLWLVFWSQLPR